MDHTESGWWGAIVLISVAAFGVTTVGAMAARAASEGRRGAQDANARLQRGEQLVRATGCGDCHTPMIFDKALGMPVPDRTHLFSGHPQGAPDPGGTLGPQDQALIGPTFTSFRTQLGLVYSANLTPDRETGLGAWKEQDFIRTLRTGKHLGGGRQILPPMPWMDVAALGDEDLGAMFAYLQSVPAQRNAVPAPKVDSKALEGLTKAMDQLRAQQKGAPRP